MEKIQGLEEQVQLISVRDMENATQKEAEFKQNEKTTKWKALTLE